MPNYNNYFPTGYGYMYPQNQQPVAPTFQNDDFKWSIGKAGIDAYMLAPNSRVHFWDSEEQVIYVKTTDSTGRPTVQILDFTIRPNESQKANPLQANPAQSQYVTRAELEEILKNYKEVNTNEQSVASAAPNVQQ